MWLVSPLPKGQKSVLDPLELELHIILNQLFCKSNVYSNPLSLLSSFWRNFLKAVGILSLIMCIFKVISHSIYIWLEIIV